MPVIFSNFLVSNEMSGYTENNSTTIFIVHELFLSYKLFKVYRNNMDHPVMVWLQEASRKLHFNMRHPVKSAEY